VHVEAPALGAQCLMCLPQCGQASLVDGPDLVEVDADVAVPAADLVLDYGS
jgi:hypothetical protein